jgi:hypothetical protein
MIRYLSYSDANEWKQGTRRFIFIFGIQEFSVFRPFNVCDECVTDMMKRIPHKIDMGAVYAVPPKQKSFASKDVFKEVNSICP